MFEHDREDTSEIHLPEISGDRNILSSAILAITRQSLPERIDMTIAPRIITLLQKYECTDAANRILYHSVQQLTLDQLFEVFVLASQLDDLFSACRIIPQGYKWYKDTKNTPVELSLSPCSLRR
jgi:hypothetical protein